MGLIKKKLSQTHLKMVSKCSQFSLYKLQGDSYIDKTFWGNETYKTKLGASEDKQ